MNDDMINSPKHYTEGGIEVIDYIEAKCRSLDGYMGYLAGNALKYLSRLDKKGEALENAKKAQWFVNKIVKELEGGE